MRLRVTAWAKAKAGRDAANAAAAAAVVVNVALSADPIVGRTVAQTVPRKAWPNAAQGRAPNVPTEATAPPPNSAPRVAPGPSTGHARHGPIVPSAVSVPIVVIVVIAPMAASTATPV